jgi:hypothetical protein
MEVPFIGPRFTFLSSGVSSSVLPISGFGESLPLDLHYCITCQMLCLCKCHSYSEQTTDDLCCRLTTSLAYWPPHCSNLSESLHKFSAWAKLPFTAPTNVSNSTSWTSRRLNPSLHARIHHKRGRCFVLTRRFPSRRKTAFILPVASMQR